MAWVLRPSRFISISCCTSVPLSNGGPPPPRIGRLHTLVRGWGIFNRLYGIFTPALTASPQLFCSQFPYAATVRAKISSSPCEQGAFTEAAVALDAILER